MKYRIIGLICLIGFLSITTPVAANDGQLDIDTNAIYENGARKEEYQRDYDIPTLFLKEKSRKNKQITDAKLKNVNNAEKNIFTSTRPSSEEIDRENNKKINKVLFTANFSGVHPTVIRQKKNASKNYDFIYLSGLVFISIVIVGIIVGKNKPKVFIKLRGKHE